MCHPPAYGKVWVIRMKHGIGNTNGLSGAGASVAGHGRPSIELVGDGLLRLPDVLALIPLSRTTFLEGAAKGIYPAPVRLGARCVAWRVSDIQAFLANLQGTRAA